MKTIKSILFNRIAIVVFFLLLQFTAIYLMVALFRGYFVTIYTAFAFFSVFVVIYIINGRSNAAYKIAWIVPVMVLPVFGTLLYFMFGKNHLTQKQRSRMAVIQNSYDQALSNVPSQTENLAKINVDAALQSRYLERASSSPLYQNTETQFYELGEILFLKILEELRKARKFIFLEYFIIKPGVMWDAIEAVLEEKVAQGVDVRLIYDDFSTFLTVPPDFCETVRSKGIQCLVFHKIIPILSGSFNNRDHRKICVIDGNVAFTGGINLADEYINAQERFGHWLDCGIMVRGAAVWSFTAMFLSIWNYTNRTTEDFSRYAPDPALVAEMPDDGYVQPFTDTPMDDEPVGENAYINMIARARRYVYICTPYLIVDNEMLTALCTAAKCGVDIRIITPGVGDKRYVHALTRSYYPRLIEAGVRIFEYTPGFIHSKTFVCDDLYAICGTINLDYRSLYLHYECAAWMCASKAVLQMLESYMDTLAHCREITREWCEGVPWYLRMIQSILRIFAPLM